MWFTGLEISFVLILAADGMLGNVTLRRPKDFVKSKAPQSTVTDEPAFSISDSLSEFGPPPSLRRPNDYYGPSLISPQSASYQMGGSGMTTPVTSHGVSAY